MNHHDVIHEVRWSWIPLFFAPLAFLACVGAIVCPVARRFLWLVGVLSIVVGSAGEYFHLSATLAERGHATIWHALLPAATGPGPRGLCGAWVCCSCWWRGGSGVTARRLRLDTAVARC